MGMEEETTVRERILDESIRLFLANGFAGTSVLEITKAAGVARGTLYWYFRSKNEILEEALDKFAREMYEFAFHRVDECDGNFYAKFNVLFRTITETALKKKDLVLMSATVLGEIAGTNSESEAKLKGMHMRFHRFLETLLEMGKREGVIRPELDTDIHAQIIMANFVGMHIQRCLFADSFDAAAYDRAYRDMVLRGLRIVGLCE